MKLKITLLELVILGLACNIAQNNGKVVGNIKDDDDGGTLTIVDIEDDNKTHYYNQNFELGSYNYGYDVKPSGPVGQFHHENKGPDEVVYGCYGYEGPDSRNHMTFYVSDAWGYRPLRQGQDIEIFYPADNPEGTGHMNGSPTKWADLFFPEPCAHVAERIASSSNVVTNQPVQIGLGSTPVSPFVTTRLQSTQAPTALSSFGTRNTPIPSGSFDVINFNLPSTIGPQPTSGRLSVSTPGVSPSSAGSSEAPTFPTTQQVAGSPFVPEQSSSNNIFPILPASGSTAAVPSSTTLGVGGSRFSTNAPGNPNNRFTGVPTTGTSSAPFEKVTDIESSNDGPLTPSRPAGNRQNFNRPSSTAGTPPNRNTGGSSLQFSRLITNPTQPSTNSRLSTPTLTGSTPNFNNLLRTTTLSPIQGTGRGNAFGTGSTLIPNSASNEVPVGPGRQPGAAYGASDDDDELPASNSSPTVGSTQTTRTTTRGFPTGATSTANNNRAPTTFTAGTTRIPSIPTEPASLDTTFSSNRNTQPSTSSPGTGRPLPTGTQTTRRQPATGVTNPLPSGGFSGSFNNPSTLQPSSTNQQTVPGTGAASSIPTTRQPGTTTTQGVPSRFSSTFQQPSSIPTTFIPQEPALGPSTSNSPSSSTQTGSSTFSTPTRSPSSFSTSNFPASSQTVPTGPSSTRTPLRNSTNPDNNEFCASQCSSCNNNKPSQPEPLVAPTDEEFLQIPGALMSNIPVIFYPDCSANAYQRPAIVPFCPSHQTQCNNNGQQPLTMRFPDSNSLFAGHNNFAGPIARNAFLVDPNQGSPRVTRKVRRGRQQRLARH